MRVNCLTGRLSTLIIGLCDLRLSSSGHVIGDATLLSPLTAPASKGPVSGIGDASGWTCTLCIRALFHTVVEPPSSLSDLTPRTHPY
jgi:hypothetical protein